MIVVSAGEFDQQTPTSCRVVTGRNLGNFI